MFKQSVNKSLVQNDEQNAHLLNDIKQIIHHDVDPKLREKGLHRLKKDEKVDIAIENSKEPPNLLVHLAHELRWLATDKNVGIKRLEDVGRFFSIIFSYVNIILISLQLVYEYYLWKKHQKNPKVIAGEIADDEYNEKFHLDDDNKFLYGKAIVSAIIIATLSTISFAVTVATLSTALTAITAGIAVLGSLATLIYFAKRHYDAKKTLEQLTPKIESDFDKAKFNELEAILIQREHLLRNIHTLSDPQRISHTKQDLAKIEKKYHDEIKRLGDQPGRGLEVKRTLAIRHVRQLSTLRKEIIHLTEKFEKLNQAQLKRLKKLTRSYQQIKSEDNLFSDAILYDAQKYIYHENVVEEKKNKLKTAGIVLVVSLISAAGLLLAIFVPPLFATILGICLTSAAFLGGIGWQIRSKVIENRLKNNEIRELNDKQIELYEARSELESNHNNTIVQNKSNRLIPALTTSKPKASTPKFFQTRSDASIDFYQTKVQSFIDKFCQVNHNMLTFKKNDINNGWEVILDDNSDADLPKTKIIPTESAALALEGLGNQVNDLARATESALKILVVSYFKKDPTQISSTELKRYLQTVQPRPQICVEGRYIDATHENCSVDELTALTKKQSDVLRQVKASLLREHAARVPVNDENFDNQSNSETNRLSI